MTNRAGTTTHCGGGSASPSSVVIPRTKGSIFSGAANADGVRGRVRTALRRTPPAMPAISCAVYVRPSLALLLLAAISAHSCAYCAPATTPTETTLHDTQEPSSSQSWQLYTRADWSARQPQRVVNINGSVPYIILHHSYIPDECNTPDACKAAMRSMQNYHVDERKWVDIGYNFAVGSDGNVYEGRGFDVVGTHAPNYNNRSIGLLLIGNFVDKEPPPQMLSTAQSFIEYAVSRGKLQPDYILYGHRQVRNTECPGAALYAIIKQWPHWRPTPENA